MIKRIYLSVIIAIASLAGGKAQMLSVNTDIALDALETPSFGVEMVVGNHTSLSINGFGNYHPWGMNMRLLAIQPEVRYYLSRRPMYHHFVGICGAAATYDMTYSSKRRNGYGIGGGITFGYVLPLSSRLNLDFHAGFTTFFYEQREYNPGHYSDSSTGMEVPLNARGHYTLPARIGVSLTYIIN